MLQCNFHDILVFSVAELKISLVLFRSRRAEDGYKTVSLFNVLQAP